MKPRLVETAPAGDGWLHEGKLEGYRTQPHIEHRQIVAAAAGLRCPSAMLDGEVYQPDARGADNFSGLPAAIRWRPRDLIFVAFDLLHIDGEDLRSRLIESRRALLADLGRTGSLPCLRSGDSPVTKYASTARGITSSP